VFLQHPREADVAIGTARMASLCLPRSELHVGVRWAGTRALASLHADPSRPPALLYPGEGATDLALAPPPGPITLVVVDGTWAQTKKVVKENPELAALPRYAFRPEAPSEYRIRREPDEAFVSTIEALSYVLGALEGDPERFRSLLEPFRAMVATQLAFVETVRARRTRRPRQRAAPGAEVPALLRERARDLVCVVAEADAWPYGDPRRVEGAPGTLVHCVAERLATGERFEAFVAPRDGLAPDTARHLELDPELLRGGLTSDAFASAWGAFLREDEVLCTWGEFTPRVLAAAGALPAGPRLDLRHTLRVLASRSPGALEDLEGRIAHGPPVGAGRGGRRLALLAALAPALLEGGSVFARALARDSEGA
jgi:DTW domain-containing protein YfiP